MRHAELTLRPSGGFHPADRAIVAATDIDRVAIRQFERLDDGTVVVLYQLRGDPGPAAAVLEADSDVCSYGLAESATEVHARVQFVPNTTVDALTRIPREYPLVVQTPVDCLPDGGLRAGVVGERETFAAAIDAVPDSVAVELASIRPHDPDDDRLSATLTARQRDVLEAAIDAGYYDVPRRATYDDIAAALDISPVTVGEHLRKIEAQVLPRVAGTGRPGEE